METLISIRSSHSELFFSVFCIFSFTGPELSLLRTESNKVRNKVYETQKTIINPADHGIGFADTDSGIC